MSLLHYHATVGQDRTGRRVAADPVSALAWSAVPDKRQQSKQRRAARNRANREALAARREAAAARQAGAVSSKASSAKASSTNGATARGGQAATAPPPPPRILGMIQSRRVGDKAVLTAFVLAVVAAIYLLFYQVPVDDRGEVLPTMFRGLAIAARERLVGEPMADDTRSLLDANGPQILVVLALPVFVAAFALWANRRPDRARMLTFAMLAMAGAVILTGGIGIFFFPAMIALAVAGFRVRKVELPARAAERAASPGWLGGRRRREVIDADSTDVTDEAIDDAPADDADDATDAEGDPLAELEAELEAEQAAEGEGEGEGDGSHRRS